MRIFFVYENMLNNIKFDPFNPSNNNTIHKKHSLCQPSKCVHING